MANLNIHLNTWHPIGVNFAFRYPKNTRTGSNNQSQYLIFLDRNAFAIIPKNYFLVH